MTPTTQIIKKLIFLGTVFCMAMPVYVSNAADMAQVSRQNIAEVDALEREGVQVRLTDKVTVIMQVDSLFRFPSSTRLQDSSRAKILDNVASLVRSYGNRLVTVSGHTDNVGSDEAKLKRSKNQAETVAAFLWSQGVPLKNILVIGCGDTEPVASNKTPEGSAANRRIEVEVG
jgi:outer membrane protein OmpA-like peptidoglycan-associated protein